MSVTFQVDANPTGKYTFSCYQDGFTGMTVHGPYANHDEALLELARHQIGCESCDVYGAHVSAQMDVDEFVNLSNQNASMMLEVLGMPANFDDGLCGSMPAAEFLARARAALNVESAIGSHAAVPSTVTQHAGGPTIVNCGQPAGYVVERLQHLIDVAETAERLGRTVTWA